MMEIDKKALNRWKKSQISYLNYVIFISRKKEKFKLTLIDLLYVSNFKGGYATINEPEVVIEQKLEHYGTLFQKINVKFQDKLLCDLEESELSELIAYAHRLLNLTDHKSETKIDGFSVSFLTTLLHFYFPNLFPILDRRVLNGLQLISNNDLNSQGQVKNLKDFYGSLISAFRLRSKNKTIRELDKELFVRKF
ncbi:MAG: hypothetical protein AB8E82_16465 [Aureispira sp.]